ncbi:MAG: gamma-glutamylcyclotransferase family protein [Actinomycetota bacterium]
MRTIFVYGLLKPGLSLHHVVAPFVERSTDGRTRGRLYDAGVPAARFDEDGDIAGVVVWIDDGRLAEALRVLDELEDEGEEYRRVVVDIETADGPVRAFAYEYLRPLAGRRDVGAEWK